MPKAEVINATKELAAEAARQLAQLKRDIPLSDNEVEVIETFIAAASRKLPTSKAVQADVIRKRARRAAPALDFIARGGRVR